MRVVHVSAYEGLSGAGRAAQRLHRALRAAGAESFLAVGQRTTSDSTVLGGETAAQRTLARLLPRLDGLAIRFRRRRRGDLFSTCLLPDGFGPRVRALAPDVVNVHWIGQGFARPETLRAFARPVVWTCHDLWAFTGGCHHPGDCRRYEARCGACPALGSERERDLSTWLQSRKARAYEGLDLTVVTPSRWLGNLARRSALLAGRRIEVLPNGVDAELFRPAPREPARDRLGLPREARVVLFAALGGAASPWKGFDLLAEALQALAGRRAVLGLMLLVAGATAVPGEESIGVPVRCLGQLEDDRALVDAYAAADVVAVPSRVDNLPSTAMEGLACGRPVVGFAVGGIPDMIEDRVNGALAPPLDVGAFAQALAWVLADDARGRALSAAARERAERDFTLEIQARRYLALYADVLRVAPEAGRSPATRRLS